MNKPTEAVKIPVAKSSNGKLLWIILGGIVALGGMFVVGSILLIVLFWHGSSSNDDDQFDAQIENQRRYNQKLSDDLRKTRDAFSPR